MIKAVIFDLDDTLISEKEYVKSGYRHIAKILSKSFEIEESKIYRDLMNLFERGSKRVFNGIFDQYGIDYSEEIITRLVSEYRSHFPNISFYKDVQPCINKLKAKNIRTGIITDGYAVSQRQKLKAIKARDYFEEMIITDELGRDFWKPNPRSFEIMKSKLDVNFNEMVYVADNPEKDFHISKIYPIQTVRIYREGIYSNREYFENIMEIYSIDTLLQLNI